MLAIDFLTNGELKNSFIATDSFYTNTDVENWLLGGNILADVTNQNTLLKARKKILPTPSKESRTDKK